MKKHSKKFWILFWISSAIFLTGWFFFWQYENKGLSGLKPLLNVVPMSAREKREIETLMALFDYATKKDGQEKTFLILYQNNMEIRPGGGYIGSFGVVKIKDGKISQIQTHDLSNFDGRVPDNEKPPYPMEETLNIKSWKMRDSNYSPDFETNAKMAEYFYHLGQGEENFDGVVALTSNILSSMLRITGPIEIEGYPGKFEADNAVLTLEYQVEKGYVQQGLKVGDRKLVMNELASAIISRIEKMTIKEKFEVLKSLIGNLNQKDIQIYLKEKNIQTYISNVGWDGKVDENWKDDYLMVVDANLGAFKSDYYVKRKIEYTIDLSEAKPKVVLKITYNHTAKQKDWMTKDYLTYVRIYVPEGSWLEKSKNFDGARYGNEFGKKYFGAIVKVPLGTEKIVELEYVLPEGIKDVYNLKIQKQAGINDVPVRITVLNKNEKKEYDVLLDKDVVLSELSY